MALDFPSNPVNGQTYDNFYYDSITGAWRSLGSSSLPNALKNVTISTATGASVPITVQGFSSQAANLQEWKNSSGTNLVSVNSSGDVTTSGRFLSSAVNLASRFYAENTSSASDQYLYIINARNDTGSKVVHFLNSSTRTLDGGANGYTIRNDGGPLTLGNASYDTTIYNRVLMPNQIAFSATANYGTNYAGNLNPVIYGNINTNIGSNYNSSNGRFTAPVAGNYFFMAHGHRNANNGYTTIRMRKNGTMFSNSWNASAGSDTVSCGGIVSLAANDYVDVQMETSQNNYMAEDYWKFMGHLVG